MKRHYCHTIDLSRNSTVTLSFDFSVENYRRKMLSFRFSSCNIFFYSVRVIVIVLLCVATTSSLRWKKFKKPNYSAHVFNRNNGDERRIHKQLHFITFNVRIARYRCFIPFYFISFYSISHYLYRTLFTNSDHKSRGCFKIIRCRGLCFRYGAAFVYLQKFNRQ